MRGNVRMDWRIEVGRLAEDAAVVVLGLVREPGRAGLRDRDLREPRLEARVRT